MRIGLIRIVLYTVCISAVIILSQFVYELRRSSEEQFRADFRGETSEFTREVEHTVTAAINYVLSVGAFFESSHIIQEDEFSRFVIRSRFLSESSYLRSISVIPLLKRGELPAFRRALEDRAEARSYNGYTPFEIREEPGRDLYAPVTYVESLGAKGDILGYDFAAAPEQMRAANAALLSTQPHMTEPVMMPHADGDTSKDVFVISAVKSNGNMGLRNYLGPNEDRTLLIAASYSPSIAISEMIKQAAMGARFNLSIFDTTDTEPKLIFGTADAPKEVTPFKTDRLVLGNRVWELDYYPLQFGAAHQNPTRYIFLGIIGIVLTLALTIAIDRLIKGRSQLERIVRERTDQLHSLNKVLGETAQQASAENDAKSMFLAHMSHELRTPLNAVIGYAQMLKKETLGSLGDPRYLDYAATIEEAGNIQLQLVEDILSLTALQGGSRELDMQSLNLREVAEKCVTLLQTRFQAKDLTVKVVSLMGAVPFIGDERSLQQIFLNLLSNAIKFTTEGGQITIRLARDNHATTTIAVEDTGVGIAPEYIAKVLQPFGQAHVNPYNAHEGVGLGLSIVTGLAEANGGTVRIESEPNKGTTVFVVFPYKETRSTEGMNI